MWVLLFLGLVIGESTVPWAQWRGPDRDGSVADTLPNPLPDKLTKQWRLEVGFGFGSPVGWQNRIYLSTRRDGKEWLVCVDAKKGTILWQRDFAEPFKANPAATKFEEGPFATPLVASGSVVFTTVTGQVFSLDAKTGKTQWQQSFDSELTGDRVLFCGNTASPLLVGSRVVVHVGDETHGRMMAFDLETGKIQWQWQGDISGYASPILAKLQGENQIVSVTQNKVVGLDPETGQVLWEYPWQVRWRENIVMPVQHGDGVIISGREQRQTVKLQPQRQGDQWQVEEVWRDESQPMYMSSPVLQGSMLLGFSHKRKGQFFKQDARTGEVLWHGPGRTAENAALLAFGDQILALTTAGKVSIFDGAATSFAIQAEYEVSETETWAHPLWMGNTLYVKSRDHLSAWRFE